ncbi:MAG: polyphosphate kinase 2 family protein [Bacteroidetes bacterium]|nr:polyphosphate kinase 2 family protein [Bacteroidota bacterium]
MVDASKLLEYAKRFIVQEDKSISLKEFDTDYDHKELTKEQGEELLKLGVQKLSELQDKLYVHNQYAVLIVIQAMDAAGKDSIVKHVMSGMNPQGVNVYSFKVPTQLELEHDFLWRHYLVLPKRGEVTIFNRSHYENVLVTKVHPEYVLKENIPGVEKVEDVNESFWEKRYKQINRFEKTLADNGTIILKFFLHVSKKEQKKRFIDRIDDPAKNWKFSAADLKERALWKEYRKAYELMLEKTSKSNAPWYIIPADDKWFARLAVAGIIYESFESLNLSYPKIDDAQKAVLAKAREELMNENIKETNGVAEN